MNLFETIKAAVPVRQAAEHYGLKVNRNGMACCPFHNDRHPSLKLNEEYFFCFGCGATGDVIEFTAKLFDLGSLQAAQRLAVDFGISTEQGQAVAASRKPKHPHFRQFREDEMGYCFIPSTKGQKMLLLIGKGGEGKSRIGIVLRALLGSNMNTGSIAKVETSPFARADLEHELVMLDDDMKLEALPQTNNIKAIITAELPMDLEKKGQQSYQGDLYVRFIGLGNGVLQSLNDHSVGFFRRQIILSTKEKDPNRKDDPYIAEKMCTEAEGIFLWALMGLHRLIANDYRFTLSQSALDNMDAAVSDGNNIIEFLGSEGYICFKADYEVSSKDLYAVYKLWCDDNAMSSLSQKRFCSFLKQNESRYNLEYTNKVNIGGGKFARGFVGIELLQRPFL